MIAAAEAQLSERCVLCLGHTLQPGFCAGCWTDLPWRRHPILRAKLPFLDDVLAAFVYRQPLDSLIRGFKFEQDMAALRSCAEALKRVVSSYLLDIDIVLPVPLGRKRYRTRAYNQAAVLAAPLARMLDRPLAADTVRRIHERGVQSLLPPQQRRTNMAGAFRVDGSVAGMNILLVDDVVTTGATLSALARALRSSKARRVHAVALAASPVLQ